MGLVENAFHSVNRSLPKYSSLPHPCSMRSGEKKRKQKGKRRNKRKGEESEDDFGHQANCAGIIIAFTLYDTLSVWQNESYITLRDLKSCKLSGSVFNILFNLNKFMAFETRDPFLIRQVNQI